MSDQLPAKRPKSPDGLAELSAAREIPAIVADAGNAVRFAWEEFFFGRIRSTHTRRAYHRAVKGFLAWCEDRSLKLTVISPADVGHYLDSLSLAPSSKKQVLAGLRHFFDGLVTRHAIVLNPAASVRADRYQVIEGKTPEITVKQARRLPVGSFTPNAFGLYDMHGNAREWCGDWYNRNYLSECPKTDPPGPMDCFVSAAYFHNGRFIPPINERKVARGGSFDEAPETCTSFTVHKYDFDSAEFGFRVLCEIGAPSKITQQQYRELHDFQAGKLPMAEQEAYRESLPLFREYWDLFHSTEVPDGEDWLTEFRYPESQAKFRHDLFDSLQNVYRSINEEELFLRTTANKIKYLKIYLDQQKQADKEYLARILTRQLAADYASLNEFDKASSILNKLLTDYPDDPTLVNLKKQIEEKRTR